MLVRSPRRLAILSLVAFLFILIVWNQSPWASQNVYQQIPLFSGTKQEPMSNEDVSPKKGGVRPLPTGGSPELATASMPPQQAVETQKPTPPWVTGTSKSSPLDYAPPRPTNMKEYMQEMLNWNRPSWEGHWPPFGDYINKEYDPNRWEQFDM